MKNSRKKDPFQRELLSVIHERRKRGLGREINESEESSSTDASEDHESVDDDNIDPEKEFNPLQEKEKNQELDLIVSTEEPEHDNDFNTDEFLKNAASSQDDNIDIDTDSKEYNEIPEEEFNIDDETEDDDPKDQRNYMDESKKILESGNFEQKEEEIKKLEKEAASEYSGINFDLQLKDEVVDSVPNPLQHLFSVDLDNDPLKDLLGKKQQFGDHPDKDTKQINVENEPKRTKKTVRFNLNYSDGKITASNNLSDIAEKKETDGNIKNKNAIIGELPKSPVLKGILIRTKESKYFIEDSKSDAYHDNESTLKDSSINKNAESEVEYENDNNINVCKDTLYSDNFTKDQLNENTVASSIESYKSSHKDDYYHENSPSEDELNTIENELPSESYYSHDENFYAHEAEHSKKPEIADNTQDDQESFDTDSSDDDLSSQSNLGVTAKENNAQDSKAFEKSELPFHEDKNFDAHQRDSDFEIHNVLHNKKDSKPKMHSKFKKNDEFMEKFIFGDYSQRSHDVEVDNSIDSAEDIEIYGITSKIEESKRKMQVKSSSDTDIKKSESQNKIRKMNQTDGILQKNRNRKMYSSLTDILPSSTTKYQKKQTKEKKKSYEPFPRPMSPLTQRLHEVLEKKVNELSDVHQLPHVVFQAWCTVKNEENHQKYRKKLKEEKLKSETKVKEEKKKAEVSALVYESWKHRKNEEMQQQKRKIREAEKLKTRKQEEDKKSKEEEAKLVFQAWKKKKDEELNEKLEKEKSLIRSKEMNATESKMQQKRNAISAFRAWKHQKVALVQNERMAEWKQQEAQKTMQLEKAERDAEALKAYKLWLLIKAEECSDFSESFAELRPPWNPPG